MHANDAPLSAEVLFRVDAASLMLCRRTLLRYHGKGPPVEIRDGVAGLFTVHAPITRIRTLEGSWAEETQVQQVEPGVALHCDRLQGIIHHGDQYLLTGAPDYNGGDDWAALGYVPKDASAGVLFAFRLAGSDRVRVFPLARLAVGRRYRCSSFGNDVSTFIAEAPPVGLPIILDRRYSFELILAESS